MQGGGGGVQIMKAFPQGLNSVYDCYLNEEL